MTGNLRAALLLFIVGAQIQVVSAQIEGAMLPNVPSSGEKLTLAGAVDLALKQNLDIQIASIETVSAFLKDRHAIWMRWFESEIKARYEATGGGLEIIADVLQEGFEDPKCFGLAFINIVTEGGDFDHEPFACWRLRSPQYMTIHTLSARVIVPLPHRSR